MRRASLPQLDAAIHDLQDRTLAGLNGDLTRLVYLSSTRDYNTGEYQHAGLADRFGADAAQRALAQCHEGAFRELLDSSLAHLVGQLTAYIESTGADRDRVLDAWRRLQAYRVLVPETCDEFSAQFFTSNVKIALEALSVELAAGPER
jgi:hypothetical protein